MLRNSSIAKIIILTGMMTTHLSHAQDSNLGAESVPQGAPQEVGGAKALDTILSAELISSLRDPFQIPPDTFKKVEAKQSELEQYTLKDFKLNGVITGPKKVKAMVTAPSGKAYFVSVGDKIGLREGHVTSVQSEKILVVEEDVDELGRKYRETFEMRLDGDVVSLSGGSSDSAKEGTGL